MVVCLVLEHEEPVLIFSIHIYGDADAACVDLLGFVEVIKFALGAQRLHPDDGNVHQRHIALLAILIERLAVIHVALIALNDRSCKESVFDIH